MPVLFSRFSSFVGEQVGRPVTFVVALSLVLVWALTGPVFGYSEIWQLLINTSTTIITFLMLFILQSSQNRDAKALHAKLDELILTSKDAENAFIHIERLDDEKLRKIRSKIDDKLKESSLGADGVGRMDPDLHTEKDPGPVPRVDLSSLGRTRPTDLDRSLAGRFPFRDFPNETLPSCQAYIRFRRCPRLLRGFTALLSISGLCHLARTVATIAGFLRGATSSWTYGMTFASFASLAMQLNARP